MGEAFSVGETIRIIEGPFRDFEGVIEAIVEGDLKRLIVAVKIFGASAPVELNYTQVEKLN